VLKPQADTPKDLIHKKSILQIYIKYYFECFVSSDSIFGPCQSCGKTISKSATTCPECGAKQKKKSIWKKIIIGIVVLNIIGFMGSIGKNEPSPQNAPDKTTSIKKEVSGLSQSLPEDQKQFIQIVTKYIKEYNGAINELQKAALRDKRKNELASVVSSLVVSNWEGSIAELDTNNDGKGVLSIKIAPKIILGTWNNALSDIASSTLIEKDSPVYQALLNFKNGTKVKFSGKFFTSETDFLEEKSLTIDGSMESPEYLFRFESVEPLQ